MRRIQDYLLCDEINESIVSEVNKQETNHAIEIREDSAFHYGASKKETHNRNLPSQMRLRRDSVADGSNPLSKRTESFTSLYQPLTQNSRQSDSTYKSL